MSLKFQYYGLLFAVFISLKIAVLPQLDSICNIENSNLCLTIWLYKVAYIEEKNLISAALISIKVGDSSFWYRFYITGKTRRQVRHDGWDSDETHQGPSLLLYLLPISPFHLFRQDIFANLGKSRFLFYKHFSVVSKMHSSYPIIIIIQVRKQTFWLR